MIEELEGQLLETLEERKRKVEEELQEKIRLEQEEAKKKLDQIESALSDEKEALTGYKNIISSFEAEATHVIS